MAFMTFYDNVVIFFAYYIYILLSGHFHSTPTNRKTFDVSLQRSLELHGIYLRKFRQRKDRFLFPNLVPMSIGMDMEIFER
jgi:hypothetical protein